MLDSETAGLIPAWNDKKLAQWERIREALPGLQLARAQEGRAQFMLTCSAHDGSFYESIVFGQLPQVVKVPVKLKPNAFRLAKDIEKPRNKRSIDLSDAQLDAVISSWIAGQSALELEFVGSVWGSDGKERVKK